MKQNMKRYNFCMPESMMADINRLAKEKGITSSALLRLILNKYITVANERRADQLA